MSLVGRLRRHADFDQGHGHCSVLASAAADRIERLEALLRRYRTETPLDHQPHMIAAEVDAALEEKP